MFIIIIACWPVTSLRYVILLFEFNNTVCCGYLRQFFMDFIGFLSMVIQVMFYTMFKV